MEQNNKTLNVTGSTQQTEIDLAELFQSFLAKWYFLLAGLVLGILIAGLYTYFLVTPLYTATSKLYMVSNSSESIVNLSDLNLGTSLSNDYKELLMVRPILEEIAEEENLPYSYEGLRRMISISTITNTRILVISVTAASPKEAKTIANALADKAVETIPVLMDTARPNIAERAIEPSSKSSPNMRRNILLGGVAGLAIVLAILTILFLMDDTVSTSEDLEKLMGILPMTVIPEGDLPSSWTEDQDSDSGGRGRSRSHSRSHAKGRRKKVL